jgi:hypothetical protein
MPTSPLPDHLTKISYILPKRDKARIERAAKELGCSMSDYISQMITAARTGKPAAPAKRSGRAA